MASGLGAYFPILVFIGIAGVIALAMVAATLSDKKAPTMFKTALNPTATRGFKAPVAIVGATALAVS